MNHHITTGGGLRGSLRAWGTMLAISLEDRLAYPLRVMEMVAHGGAMSSPRTHEAARAAIASCRLEAPVFDALLRDFEQAARREIAAGVGDFRRSSPLTRAWRRWLPVRGPGPG